jgi:hypothetical protein
LPQIQHPGAPLRTGAGGAPAAAPAAGAVGPSGERLPIINSTDGSRVYIEGGQDLKLAVGDRYDVRQVTKVLTLSNGQKSEIRERVETVVIDDVQGALSIAHVDGGQASKAKAGDTLQKSTSLPPILQGPPPPPARTPVPARKFLPGNPR